MGKSCAEFWKKNFSKIFSLTILLGLLLASPAALLLLAYSQDVIAVTNARVLQPLGIQPVTEVINLGEKLDQMIGEEWSYRVTILAFQLGMTGASVWCFPAMFKLVTTKLDNFFSPGALSLYVLFFLGLQFGITCWEKLRIAGMGSGDTPVAGAILLTATVLILALLYLEPKTRETT